MTVGLPRTVVILGCVSLLNDVASDMVLPLLPIFLTATLGAGPAILGLIEGLAEATASVLKLIAGRLSDRGVSKRRLVLAGYGLSNLVRPLLALVGSWMLVLALRFADRIGKGLRTAPRDAMIAAAAAPGMRGRAFGFHRSMDHLGAMIGPLLAFALLAAGFELREVFLLSALPGVAVLLLLGFGLPAGAPSVPLPATRLSWRLLHRRLRALIAAAGMLALASVPEAFLVLWAVDAGLDIVWVPLIWAAASLAKTVVAWPAGLLADRHGRLPILLFGWSARVASLMALALAAGGTLTIWVLFLVYAAAVALTEAAERALIGDSAAASERGTAFGVYHLVSGVLALPGAILFGVLWQRYGASVAFSAAAALTALAAAAMAWLSLRPGGPVQGRDA